MVRTGRGAGTRGRGGARAAQVRRRRGEGSRTQAIRRELDAAMNRGVVDPSDVYARRRFVRAVIDAWWGLAPTDQREDYLNGFARGRALRELNGAIGGRRPVAAEDQRIADAPPAFGGVADDGGESA